MRPASASLRKRKRRAETENWKLSDELIEREAKRKKETIPRDTSSSSVGGKGAAICARTSRRARRPKSKKHPSAPTSVTLPACIPEVVKWVRSIADCHPEALRNPATMSYKEKAAFLTSLRQFILSRIDAVPDLGIEMDRNGMLWRGNARFWKHVVRFAAALPPQQEAKGIFEAMRRYTSSRLVNSDFRTLFGNEKLVNDKASTEQTVYGTMSRFAHFSRQDIGAPHWFERTAYSRLQEVAVHMIAITEYIMQQAYSERSDDACADYEKFLQRIRECIQFVKQEDGTFLATSGCSNGQYLATSGNEYLLLSVRIAYEAVIKGTTIAGRRHGCKKTRREGTRRLGLQFLRRIPAEVMDTLVIRLSTVVNDIFGDKADSDQFELEMTKLLRKVDNNFQSIGAKFYSLGSEYSREDVPLAGLDACNNDYKFNPVRLAKV